MSADHLVRKVSGSLLGVAAFGVIGVHGLESTARFHETILEYGPVLEDKLGAFGYEALEKANQFGMPALYLALGVMAGVGTYRLFNKK